MKRLRRRQQKNSSELARAADQFERIDGVARAAVFLITVGIFNPRAITFARRGRIINHDIDPQVDIERDFIGADLATAGSPQIQYLQPAKPVFEAETVSGEAYHSDSRILMLDLHHGETVTAASQTRATGPEPTLSTATPAPATVLRSRLN